MTSYKQNYVFSEEYTEEQATHSVFDQFTHAEMNALFQSCKLISRFMKCVNDDYYVDEDVEAFCNDVCDNMQENILHRVEEIENPKGEDKTYFYVL